MANSRSQAPGRPEIPWRNTPERYGAVAQGLHWLIALLVLAQLILGWRAADLPMGLDRLQLLGYHKSLGISVFVLVLLRLGWRLYSSPPALPEHMSSWEKVAAQCSHWLFYLILLIMPLLGWISSSASNLSVSWFGLFTLPDLVEPTAALADWSKAAHHLLARLLVVLLLLHIGAALRHHFIKRDNVLRRMLPGWRPHASDE